MIVCGLCEGRHAIPQVEEYIFPNTVEDVFAFGAFEEDFLKFYAAHGGDFEMSYASPPNAAAYDDVVVYKGTRAVRLYVTGLTPVLTAVINCAYKHGISLELMHYDRATNSYRSQRLEF